MSTTRLFMSGVLLLGMLGVLGSGGFAVSSSLAAEPSDSDPNAAVPAPAAPPAAAVCTPMLERASQVLHARVTSADGKTIGRVHDLVLTPDLKGISYAAVSSDNFLGMDGTMHAVPWPALRPSINENSYMVPLTKAQFKTAGVFHNRAWPNAAEPGWAAATPAPAYGGPMTPVVENVKDCRFTHIRGSEVRGAAGGKAGDVRDLVIVMDTGQIAYTIVSYGGLLGIGARYAAVPDNAIRLEPARRLARLDVPVTVVHANSFPPSRWPDLASPVVSRQLAQAFGVPPTGPVLAFVPPGPVAAAPSRTPPRSSPRTTTPPPSGAAVGAEPTPAELTGTFNPSAITSIDATVLSEGKFRITSTGPEMLWLRVRTTDNRTVLVNLGPRSYVASQNFYIVPGDRIHLTGSEVATTRGRQVFLPTEATYENQTLRLRSATGTPLWEGPGATTAPPGATTTSPGAITTPPGQQPGATTSPSSQLPPSSQPGAPPLGYVPGQEPGAAGQAGATGQPMTQFTPPGILSVGVFDVSHPQTIEGTVTEVGKSQPPGGGPEVIWLRVRTSTGQFINVQVGPQDYVSKQGFFVANGDQVRMNGWNARTPSAPGATPVFIPGSISQDGRTLQLRNRGGEPLWTSQMGATGQTSEGPMPGAVGSTQRSTSRSTAEPNEPNKP